MKMYLDDLRHPTTGGWDIVRSSDEAKAYVLANGLPEFVSFDHDLGGDDTAMVFVKWLVGHDMDNAGAVIPDNFRYSIHSANPVGAKNIDMYLLNYLDVKKNG